MMRQIVCCFLALNFVRRLSENEDVSEKFSRPEVLKILRAYYAGIKEEDKVEIKMSGTLC